MFGQSSGYAEETRDFYDGGIGQTEHVYAPDKDGNPKQWNVLPHVSGDRYIPGDVTRYRIVPIVDDRLPTPRELADTLNKYGIDTLNTRFTDAYMEQGIYEIKLNPGEMSSGDASCSIPSGVYQYRCSANPPCLLVSPFRSDIGIHLGDLETLVQDDISKFLKSRDKYAKVGMYYRRGYLFYGDPGNGKTCLVRRLIDHFFKDAIVVRLDREPPDKIFCTTLAREKRLKVFVIEELSSLAETFRLDSLLNFLDGEDTIDNSIVLATTNFSGRLPLSLVNRPSRFDLLLNVGNPPPDFINRIFVVSLEREPTTAEMKVAKDMSLASIRESIMRSDLNGTSFIIEARNLEKRSKIAREEFTSKAGFGQMEE